MVVFAKGISLAKGTSQMGCSELRQKWEQVRDTLIVVGVIHVSS